MTATTSSDAAEVGKKLLSEFKEEAYDLTVESQKSQFECLASITVHDLENSIAPADLINLLKPLGISESLDLEQVAIFCTESAQGNNPKNFLLAEGVSPVTGKDGWFELAANTGKEKTEFKEDEKGRVDFKAVQTFSNIEPGQVIGIIHPPGEGTPGKTITGEPIPPQPGKPVNLIAGDGVKLSQDDTQAIATKAGRVVFENRYLTISEELIISGDVDLKVGNINFNGFVEIKGDVLDDFNIRASKGISVLGAIGACRIESDGPVSIGSMAGMGSGLIRCKGDLQARYLNQVTVECWGDVRVAYEIRNSLVKATGAISVPAGVITGGQSVSLEGIEAKILGARAGAKTILTAGVYFPDSDRLQFLRTRLKSITYQLKKTDEILPLLKRKPLDELRNALREATELRIIILSKRQVKLKVEQDKLTAELSNFEMADQRNCNPKINALSSLKERVIINLGETTEEIKIELDGPVSIIENTQSGGLRNLTYSPLKISAGELEEELHEAERDEPEQEPPNSL